MKIEIRLTKKSGKTSVLVKHFAEEFEKFDDYFMINQRGIKETYKIKDLIEQEYEYLLIFVDNNEILNERIVD